jgi:hypothetical protein
VRARQAWASAGRGATLDQWRRRTQQKIADELEVPKPTVAAVITRLNEKRSIAENIQKEEMRRLGTGRK